MMLKNLLILIVYIAPFVFGKDYLFDRITRDSEDKISALDVIPVNVCFLNKIYECTYIGYKVKTCNSDDEMEIECDRNSCICGEDIPEYAYYVQSFIDDLCEVPSGGYLQPKNSCFEVDLLHMSKTVEFNETVILLSYHETPRCDSDNEIYEIPIGVCTKFNGVSFLISVSSASTRMLTSWFTLLVWIWI